MPIDIDTLRAAIHRIKDAAERAYGELNELDGQLGDGDLGITLRSAFQALALHADEMPDELGDALLGCAGKVAEVSSSSFGTLMATALIGVGKQLGDRRSVEWSELADLLDAAQQRMMARGKANLGDKTVLDVIAAAVEALRTSQGADEAARVVPAAVERTIADFRGKPNKAGRARIFAERSVGLDDPGMVAFRVMVTGAIGNGR